MATLQILCRLGYYWMSLKCKHYSVYKFPWFLGLRTGWSIYVIVNLSLSLSPSRRVWCHQNVLCRRRSGAPDFVDSSEGYLSFSTKAELNFKSRDNGCESEKCVLTLSKSPFPIAANYCEFSEVQYSSSSRHHTSAGETNSSTARQLLHARDYKLNCLRRCNISER